MRQTNFEVLRAVLMLFVVLQHFVRHGCTLMHAEPTTAVGWANEAALTVVYYMVAVAVNGYVMITGYFLIEKTEMRLERLGRLWRQVVFFSVLVFLVVWGLGLKPLDAHTLAKACLPFVSGTYWFVSRYAALTLLAPFLARMAAGISRRGYETLLAVLFVLNFSMFGWGYGAIFSGWNSLFWFVFLFFAGGYVRRYRPLERYKGRLLWGYAAGSLLLAAAAWTETAVKGGPQLFNTTWSAYNGLLFFPSLLLFLWAAYHRFGEGWLVRLLVRVAPYTLGVYLLHDNCLGSPALWGRLWRPDRFVDTPWALPYMAAVALTIFCCGVGADWLRSRLYKKIGRGKRL